MTRKTKKNNDKILEVIITGAVIIAIILGLIGFFISINHEDNTLDFNCWNENRMDNITFYPMTIEEYINYTSISVNCYWGSSACEKTTEQIENETFRNISRQIVGEDYICDPRLTQHSTQSDHYNNQRNETLLCWKEYEVKICEPDGFEFK